jgi:hypothetical protein
MTFKLRFDYRMLGSRRNSSWSKVSACNRPKALLELTQPLLPFLSRRHSPWTRGAKGGHIPLSVPGDLTGAKPMFYDLPWWVMGLMLLAVIGLIVLLIYLRKKDKE